MTLVPLAVASRLAALLTKIAWWVENCFTGDSGVGILGSTGPGREVKRGGPSEESDAPSTLHARIPLFMILHRLHPLHS